MRDSATIYLMEHSLVPGDGTPAERTNGWSKIGLSDEGRKLAQQTAVWLRGHNIGETYSSDLPRGVQTAAVVHDYLGLKKPNTERLGLRPMNLGLYAGLPKDETHDALADLKARKWVSAPGGESYGKFLGRWGQELHRTIHEALGEDYNCLYVTHSHNLGSLDHHLFDSEPKLHAPIGPAGIILLHITHGGGHAEVEHAYDPRGNG